MKEQKRVTLQAFNEQGEEIAFADFVNEYGGPDLYENYISEILKSWKHSDWVHASDFIAPIAAQVITDACELDPELYQKIMTVIEEAYDKLGYIVNKPHITRIK